MKEGFSCRALTHLIFLRVSKQTPEYFAGWMRGPEWWCSLVSLLGLKDTALWTSAKTLKQVGIKTVALVGRTYVVQHNWLNVSSRDETWLWVKLSPFHAFPVGKTSLLGPLSWRWFEDCAESCGTHHAVWLGSVFAGVGVWREPPKTV